MIRKGIAQKLNAIQIYSVNLPLLSIQKLRTWSIRILCAALLMSSASARVGESKSSIEGRMLKNRMAVEVPSRLVDVILKDRSIPYKQIFEHLPSGAVHELYYKPAEAEAASASDFDANRFPPGWMIHVVYYNGKSVFEAYRRNGPGINQYEEQGLLNINKGDSHWEKPTPEAIKGSALGITFVRKDEEVNVLKKGSNYLIFYIPNFDASIKEKLDEENSKSEDEQKTQAPDSLRGF